MNDNFEELKMDYYEQQKIEEDKAEKAKKKYMKGHDSRLSNMRIKDIVINSLSSIGVNVYYCGLSSTPAMSMAPKILSCCSAIEITASHHPKEYNGFKFFTLEGGLKSYNIEEILKIACNEYFPKSSVLGEVRNVNLMSKYTSVLKNMVVKELESKNPLEGFKIVVDASNGAGVPECGI